MSSEMSNALHGLADGIEPLLDLCAGYRTKAIERGLSEETAEIFAQQLHQMILSKMVTK